METKLIHQDGMEYELLGFESKKDLYLLERTDRKDIPCPYVVAHYPRFDNQGYLTWGSGYYCPDLESARQYFAEEIAMNLEQKNLNNLFERIYDDVDYFNKFKMICLKERPHEYKDFTDSDWDKFYSLYMDDDTLSGFMSAEVLDTLEERMRGED